MDILTTDLKIFLADSLYDSFAVTTNTTFHMVGCNPEPFANVSAPNNSIYQTQYEIHDKLLFGKRIEADDVRYMIRNIPWEAGAEYDTYDDIDGDLATKDFFVVADQTDGSYAVFKCLYKTPFENPVTVNKPNKNQTAADENIYITGDGYHWKYMFSISSSEYEKFATSNFVPVVVDADVAANAVSGSIDAIVIESSGAQYNNYGYATVREVINTIAVSLESTDFDRINTYDLLYTSNGASTFAEGDEVDIDVPGANTVTATVFKIGPSSISFEIVDAIEDITQATVLASNTYITVTSNTVTADVLRIRQESVSTLSNVDDFYNGSVMYIRAGAGAGETRTITDYTVTGNQKVVKLESAFSVPLDLTSTVSILPRIDISGDGSNARAIPVIDTTANSIIDVQILDIGSGYTHATANVVGVSGIIEANGQPILPTVASLRPTIAPIGGHGSDVVRELFATNIGMSVTFANTDVRDDWNYSRVAVIKNLLFDNIELTLDALANADFTIGETVNQEDIKASGIVAAKDIANNVLTLTNVFGKFEVANNSLIGASGNTYATISSINSDTNLFDNTVLFEITVLTGTFQAGEFITQTNTNAVGYVIAANSSVLTVTDIFNTFSTNVDDIITGNTSSATALLDSIGDSVLIDNSGKTIWIENMEELNRASDTSEKIKLVIQF